MIKRINLVLAIGMSSLLFVLNANAADCPAGKYSSNGKDTAPGGCIPAPLGKYVDTVGAIAAIPAPLGKYVDTVGAIAAKDAPLGHYVDKEGQAEATPAPLGKYVDTVGAIAAKDAPLGHYVDKEGQAEATPAPLGKYVDTVGAIAAKDAPLGHYVDKEGQAEATPASLGKYVDAVGAIAAKDAPLGHYVDKEGQAEATPAPLGKYVDTVGAIAAKDAPLGHYVDTVGATEAKSAPEGTYVAIVGANSFETCPEYTNSYGGAEACRATDARAIPGIIVVGPEYDSNFGFSHDADIGLIDLNSDASYLFELFNRTDDLGYSSMLTDLTIFDITFSGLNASWFSFSDFLRGSILHEGDNLPFYIDLDTSVLGEFNVTMSITTDQYADFSEEGDIFTYDFRGVVQQAAAHVPEPSSWMLFLFALSGLLLTRKYKK